MASSSNSNNNNNNDHLFVDDFYFSALFDTEEEIFPIADELYAEELQLQEALISNIAQFYSRVKHEPITRTLMEDQENRHDLKMKKIKIEQIVESSSTTHQISFCGICRDSKSIQEMFKTTTKCTHSYCNACIASYIASKIQDSVLKIKCPDMNCEAVLEPHLCHGIIPKQAFARWKNALSKALIFGSKIFCCPYKDCAAVMVDDNGEIVKESECPNCHRLFCCQCNVSWHVGLDCKEFQRLGGGERQREDLMMMELAKKKQWRRCPNCKFYVEKRDGCLHISCRYGM
ncbi:hypothetical protein QYF36_019271 [Acer negundo]|nr:hypothetical protein QYF36_019271 [Acer negundo]